MRFNFCIKAYFSQNKESNGLEDESLSSNLISQNIFSSENQLQSINRLSFPPPQEGFFVNFQTEPSTINANLYSENLRFLDNSIQIQEQQRHQLSPALNELFIRRLAIKKDKQFTNQENGGNEKGFS